MPIKHLLTTEEKDSIATLTAQGLSPNAVGQRLRRDRKTIVKALQEPQTIELVEQRQLLFSDQLQAKAEMMLEAVTPESLEKMNAQSLMVAIGIATDKIRTIRGMANQNIAIQGVVIHTNCQELQDLMNGKLPGISHSEN